MGLIVPLAARGKIVEDADAPGPRGPKQGVNEVAADKTGASNDKVTSLRKEHMAVPLPVTKESCDSYFESHWGFRAQNETVLSMLGADRADWQSFPSCL